MEWHENLEFIENKEMSEGDDIYNKEILEEFLDQDIISEEEEAFMLGYLGDTPELVF